MNKKLKKILFTSLSVLFLCTCFTSCLREILNPEGGYNVVIEGTVYDKLDSDQKPLSDSSAISGVYVESNYGVTKTNSNGKFTILASIDDIESSTSFTITVHRGKTSGGTLIAPQTYVFEYSLGKSYNLDYSK
ncbi:MAG: hypothetical protein MJ179_09105 [Treponema sp.]|nr:hypothetical protein [Treponema sp.]